MRALPTDNCDFRWLPNGDEAFNAMLAAIEAARRSVRLETYIYGAGALGDRFRAALIRAIGRGVEVKVLVDSWGSALLASNYWQPLVAAGGQAAWFNPLSMGRISFRNHRKTLVCDDQVAFVGGYNVSSEYEGDGISRGWRDLGLQLEGPLARELGEAFDQLFANAEFKHGHFMRFRRAITPRQKPSADCELLLGCPGRGRSPLQLALSQALGRAGRVDIIAAYFLPPAGLRRTLQRSARRGAKVRLILPAKSDVPLLRLASHGLYQGFLQAGVEIYEYQPQKLHAKLVVADDVVFVGSANLDPRSFQINYELLLRLSHPGVALGAREIFNGCLEHCRRIEPLTWRKSRGFWAKLQERWARFLFARVDVAFARRQLRYLS